MNPVVVAFDGDAGDVGVFKGLQDFDGFGEGSGENLADVKQVATDQDKINLCFDGVGDDSFKTAEEIIVAFCLTYGGAVSFAEVDVGGVDEAHWLLVRFEGVLSL